MDKVDKCFKMNNGIETDLNLKNKFCKKKFK